MFVQSKCYRKSAEVNRSNHENNYYKIRQQTKQSASHLLSKLVSAGKAAEIDGQSLEDNLVQRFLSSMTDQKLTYKILETPKVD